MEEILASIRRIIADDETATPAGNSNGNGADLDQAASDAEHGGTSALSEDDIEDMLGGMEGALNPDASSDTSLDAPEGEVLELTPEMEAPEPPPEPVFRTIDGHNDVYFGERMGETHQRHSMAFEHQFNEDEPAKRLLSDDATAAVSSAFGTLAHTVLAQNARTLDDLVREMLRPMLKTWLDDNLPTIVERLVRAEIERVSRGRG